MLERIYVLLPAAAFSRELVRLLKRCPSCRAANTNAAWVCSAHSDLVARAYQRHLDGEVGDDVEEVALCPPS